MDTTEQFKLMLDKAIESEPLAFLGFGRTKNVQDQLQEMISISPIGLYRFWEFIRGEWNPYSESYDSYRSDYMPTMEQLWLAFVMKEKYNKVWDGRDWIEEVIMK